MSSIKFIPLSGALNEDPLCYILDLDDYYILLDCGIDEKFSVQSSYIQELSKYVSKIKVVLLSHSDLSHCGALPYLVEKLGMKAQIFATLPVVKMGLMFLYDSFQNKYQQEDFDTFDLDDIDNAFNITILKYSQKIVLNSEKGDTITISPFPSGHSLGGTIWKITKEEEDILYAVDFNHRGERHLNRTAIETLGRPSVLITDSYNALNTSLQKNIDTLFFSTIITTLAVKRGNVLIPADTAGRVFEILLILDTFWRKDSNRSLHPYSIIFLSNMSFRSVEFASHQLEWMSEEIVKGFDEKRENPFLFKHIKLKHNIKDLDKINSPMVVIATSNTLDSGFSRDLFVKWASNENNMILLTDKSKPGTLARKLYQEKPKRLTLQMKKRVPLIGEELDEYEHKRLMLKEAEKKKRREEEARKKVIEVRDEESDDEKLDEKANDVPMNPRLFLPENIRYHSQYLMFPCIEKTYEIDEYGQKVNIDELSSRSNKNIEIDEDDEENFVQDEKEEIYEPPTKCIEETIQLDVKCQIEYIDFEGRSNQKSIRNIIETVNPKKVILIHGTKESTEDLKNYLTEKKICELVLVPQLYKPVEIPLDTNFFKIKLVEELLNQIDFVKFQGFDISFIEGKIQKKEKDILLTPKQKQGHSCIFLGEIKLTNFREMLLKEGIKAEFKKGFLICNDSILVRKDKNGDIKIDGSCDKDYFKVRDLLYSQYKII